MTHLRVVYSGDPMPGTVRPGPITSRLMHPSNATPDAPYTVRLALSVLVQESANYDTIGVDELADALNVVAAWGRAHIERRGGAA